MKLFKKTATVSDDDHAGTWADTGYHASDEEAHRNVTYPGASPIMRIVWIFMCQMKLYAKNKWTFILIFAAVLIPVIVIGLADVIEQVIDDSSPSVYMGYLLIFLPVMVSFFTSVLCGSSIPREFKDRTAYMSIPLPVNRLEFYFGKYLAGFVLCVGAFLLAFGFAAALTTMKFGGIETAPVWRSMGLTILAIFAYSSFAFCIGTFLKRGSSLLPILLMFVVLPVLLIALGIKYGVLPALEDGATMSQAFRTGLFPNMMLAPCFLPDMALASMGVISIFSVDGVMMNLFGIPVFPDISNVSIVAVVWAVAFLAIGAIRMMRREM